MTQYIEINLLKEASYNPRKPLSLKEYEKLKRSFKEFGEAQPIIINKDYTIIAGHQRVKVMKDLGFTKVECKVLDLSKEKEKALNIALNKIQGEWDNDKLTEVIGDLFETDFVNITGFDEKEILDLIKTTENMHETDELEDIIKDAEREIISEKKEKKYTPESIPIDNLKYSNNQEEKLNLNDKFKSFIKNKTEQKIDINFSLNSSQNELVIKAIELIKKRDNLIYSSEAIYKICEEWLKNEKH